VRRVAVLDANTEHVARMRSPGLDVEVAMGYAGATKASMLQDLERGLKTEVDVINGAVVDRGREYGVETPVNARVVALMHAMERGERRPGRDVFGELGDLIRGA
jgi:2-dehydropantoate 2-reductase